MQLLAPNNLGAVSGKTVVLDVETTGLHWWSDKMIGVGVYCPEEQVEGYIPTLLESERLEVWEQLWGLDPSTQIVGHNLKFDFHFLGLDPQAFTLHDTTLMIHMLDSRHRKGMAQAEQTFLGTASKRKHVTEAPKRTPIHKWPLEVVADYCINDCRVTYQLAQTLAPKLRNDGLWSVYLKDTGYLKHVWAIERKGLQIDPDFVSQAIVALKQHEDELARELWDSVGYEFNWRSPKQLSKAIYEDMGISKPINPYADADGVDRSRFADRGQYNSTMTSTFILMEKADHPLGELISTLRESNKLKTTLASWLKLMDDDCVIHTNFNLTGTRTGRLSSSKPNVQNIPSLFRTRFTQGIYTGTTERAEEYNLRNAFVARPGHSFVAIDWRQMEMRMFGILSGDPFMLESLAAGRDIHGDIGHAVWNQRTPKHREWSKTISFGLIYGMTTGSVQHKLNMTRSRANEVVDQYWATFPRIRPWLFEVIANCERLGYVRYWSGRVWREESQSHMYKGANAMIQGGCADVLSIATMRTNRWLLEQGNWDTHIVSLVHDELILETPDKSVKGVVRNVSRIMRLEDLFNIPWFTDAKVGKSYGTMEKYELRK